MIDRPSGSLLVKYLMVTGIFCVLAGESSIPRADYFSC
jgi:hypothetical protein